MDRVTFATSSGIVWLALAVHFTAGLASIAAGAVALTASKGGRLHKQAGRVFTWGMVVLGLSAVGIGFYENNAGQVFAGLVAAYLVYSAMTTVKPAPWGGRLASIALMLVAFACAAAMLYAGISEWLDPTLEVTGRPRVGPPLVGGTVFLFAAVGDVRVIRSSGLRRSQRLARHLWRMCFGLFIATGSFFLGQMQFIPEPLRVMPLILVLAFAPIPFLFYWLWLVKVRRRFGA